MKTIQQPTKEKIREYMTDRVKSHKPPPSEKEIRRALGWELVEMGRKHAIR